MNERYQILTGDRLTRLSELLPDSIDAFIGETDSEENFPGILAASIPALKPGAHCVFGASPRYAHTIGNWIEEAGLEIRDCIALFTDRNAGLYWLCRKQFSGSVAANMLSYGTAAININACRTDSAGKKWETPRAGFWETDSGLKSKKIDNDVGRWPANVLLSRSAAEEVDMQTGDLSSNFRPNRPLHNYDYEREKAKNEFGFVCGLTTFNDSGGGSRFFNVLEMVDPVTVYRHLVRLITPRNGVVLDCLEYPGNVAKAAMLEGFRAVVITEDKQKATALRISFSEGLPLAAAPLSRFPQQGKVKEEESNLFTL